MFIKKKTVCLFARSYSADRTWICVGSTESVGMLNEPMMTWSACCWWKPCGPCPAVDVLVVEDVVVGGAVLAWLKVEGGGLCTTCKVFPLTSGVRGKTDVECKYIIRTSYNHDNVWVCENITLYTTYHIHCGYYIAYLSITVTNTITTNIITSTATFVINTIFPVLPLLVCYSLQLHILLYHYYCLLHMLQQNWSWRLHHWP